jgi:hypothetical protein
MLWVECNATLARLVGMRTTLLLPLLLASLTLVGVYREREFGTHHVFLKHRPSARLFFCAPLGEADRSYTPGHEGYLTPQQVEEEQAYVEFVEENGGWKRSVEL